MERTEFQAFDPRLVFKCYAAIGFAVGCGLVGWGPMWLGRDLLGVPGLQAALIRIFGSVLMAAACCAVHFAKVEDPVAARRGLAWFAAAHAIVMCVLLLQQQAIVDSRAITFVLYWLWYSLALFLGSWTRVPTGPISLFSRAPRESTDNLRSRYELEIREAAGQEERNRLARDLHDSIKQQMFVIQTAAATAQARFDADEKGAREALEQVRGSARSAITELDAMLTQLRAEPLGKQGLVEAIRKECEALGFRTGAKVECRIGTVPPNEALAPGAQRSLLRVVQESFANIGRHARASNVTLSLDSLSDKLELKIDDDGQGFDMASNRHGMGLGNMRERADELDGTFEIRSRQGAGTTVVFTLPVTTMKPPRVYLRDTILWAVLLVGCGVNMVMGLSKGVSAISVLVAVYFLQNLSAYSKARKARS